MKDDLKILDRYVQGDVNVIGEIFAVHYKDACHLAYRIVNDRDMAQDIVVDVFFNLLERRPVFDSEAGIRYKLYSDVRYKALDALKARSIDRLKDADSNEFPDSPDGEEMIARQMDRVMLLREIYEEINRLPSGYQTVIRKHFLYGQTVTEIARDLNLTHNAVSMAKKRGIAVLKDRLKHLTISDIEHLISITLLLCDYLNYS